jgi:transglutaminase-like putative cysteine protease
MDNGPVPFHVLVSTSLTVPVEQAGRLAVCLAVAAPDPGSERLSATHADGAAVDVAEVATSGGRVHVMSVDAGEVTVEYSAAVTPPTASPSAMVTAQDELVYLRPSRYCPSDRIAGLATALFGGLSPTVAVGAIEQWLNEEIRYEPGSTFADDDALHPLLMRSGVCRDFAHLGVAVCRALGVPARYVSAYAPGLDPMDFHAVVEAAVDGRWRVFDGTRLAPRQSLVRIAYGRDAADTALVTPMDANIGMVTPTLTVTAQPDLPNDDRTSLVSL